MMSIFLRNMCNRFKSVALFLKILVTLVLSRGYKFRKAECKFNNYCLGCSKMEEIL